MKLLVVIVNDDDIELESSKGMWLQFEVTHSGALVVCEANEHVVLPRWAYAPGRWESVKPVEEEKT